MPLFLANPTPGASTRVASTCFASASPGRAASARAGGALAWLTVGAAAVFSGCWGGDSAPNAPISKLESGDGSNDRAPVGPADSGGLVGVEPTRGAATPSERQPAEKEPRSTETVSSGGAFQPLTSDANSDARPAAKSPSPETADNPSASAKPVEGAEPADGARPPAASQAVEAAPAAPAKAPPEKLFENWPEPKFVFLLTGRQDGYLEPCGCTGLANQKGGMVRKHTLYQELGQRGWEVVSLDAGNQVRRFGRQSEIKYQVTLSGLKALNCRAITFGPDDLRLSTSELFSLMVNFGEGRNPFVAANVVVLDPALTPKHQIIEVRGKRIGVTAVLGDEHHKKILNDEVTLRPAVEGLREAWAELEAAKCDLHVLLAHASLEESRRLARAVPKFQLVVTAGGEGEPTFEPETLADTGEARSQMVQVGAKGMYAGVVGVFDDPQRPLRYQRVPLDARFVDSKPMLELLKSYQLQLQGDGFERLGVKPAPHPSGKAFVGSEACADCHSDEYDVWKNSKHAHATDSLVNPGERSEIPRHHDPECLSCHVTGWNAQEFYPYRSGYWSLADTPKMHNVGCEDCHGPGADHVASERREVKLTRDEKRALRDAMKLPLDRAERKCMECHDLDNSPDFHAKGAFEKYWSQIAH